MIQAPPIPFYADTGGRTVYHGEARDIMRALPEASVDLVLTDPPYSSGGLMRSDRNLPTSIKYQESDAEKFAEFSGDNRDQHSFILWASFWISDAARLLRSGGAVLTFIDWRNLHCMIDAVQVAGLIYRGIIAWDKGLAVRPLQGWFRSQIEFLVCATRGPIDRGPETDGVAQPGVLSCPAPHSAERVHATQKPTALLSQIMRTRNDWQTVLDPFMGSGSTLVAAKELGRKAIGIEIERHYCDVAVGRLRQGVIPCV